VCVLLATQRPWLGVTLDGDATLPAGPVTIMGMSDAGSALGAATGATVTVLIGRGDTVAIVSRALLEEPDYLDSWQESAAFYAMQDRLARVLQADTVQLVHVGTAGVSGSLAIVPRTRPIDDLPAAFWWQLLFGVAGLVIGVWAWALRPDDWGVRAYAFTGAMMLVFTHSAAVYSTRELALPLPLFRTLAALNHLGADLFGIALCGIFLAYPRLLVRPRTLLVLVALTLLWWLGDTLRLWPDQNWASRFLVMGETIAALAIAVVQWRRAKGDPLARAALRWFGFCALAGSGSFIVLTQLLPASGLVAPIAQGYAFGFFVLMYAGLALGLRRHRLFELDEWSLRILGWAGTVLVLLIVDVAMVQQLRLSPTTSIAAALALTLVYLPARQWLWDRLVRRRTPPIETLLGDVVTVAFARNEKEQARQWRALLTKVFDPLHITEGGTATDASVVDDGLALEVPAIGAAPAFRLTHPFGGRRLFTPTHATLAASLVQLTRTADDRRRAYLDGVVTERSRIARDLHDDVSSPLLAELARSADADTHANVRQAITQMRDVVSGTLSTPMPIADVMADIRYEGAGRLRGAGLEVQWPIADLPEVELSPEQVKALVSYHRELFTNILKHARATRVTVQIRLDGTQFESRITDDGVGFATDGPRTGQGLPNLEARARALDGTATLRSTPGNGTIAELRAPIAVVVQA